MQIPKYLKVQEQGRVQLPKNFVEAEDVKQGDMVLLSVDEIKRLRVDTSEQENEDKEP